MKILTFFAFFILLSVNGFSQNSDVDVYEKKDGDNVIIIARNTGKTDYTVKVTITSEGMDVTPSNVIEASVPAGYMKEMATITPRPGESWSYGYDVSIKHTTKTVNKAPTSTPGATTNTVSTNAANTTTVSAKPELSSSSIVLYAKPGCGRCTFAKKQLNALGIQYFEVDTQSSSPEVPNMWAQLRNQGFKGGSVTMPVMRVNGQYHYDIKDLEGFIKGLKDKT